MAEDTNREEQGRSLIGRPSVMDVGIGVLYFFTSHMVIRAMYYIGVDRTPDEITAFFLTVVAAAVAAHLCSGPFLKFRLLVESTLGVPAVSAVATAGVTLALVSMLPVTSILVFYAAGALLGLACGWIVVIWTSTIRVDKPDANSFYLHPSLVVAVVSYFLFRFVSTFSETITQGFLLALPLVTIACIIRSYRSDPARGAAELQENAQALQVLVVVAAAFAVGCGVAVSMSGRSDDLLSSGLNYMVLFEVLAVSLMVFCCFVMSRFSQRGSFPASWATAAITFGIVYLPVFLIGLMMGGAGIPANSPDALWESNVWVLMIAIFAYDIRESPYAVRGLAIGVMFETMCFGQIVAYVSTLNLFPFALPIAVGLTVLYGAAICWQLSRSIPSKASAGEVSSAGDSPTLAERPAAALRASGVQADDEPPSELVAYCAELATTYSLTPREAEILELIAMGRSATYIAEELTISHNTTRTHIKHVYEKLNIHSKQELIDLVLYGSGMMG